MVPAWEPLKLFIMKRSYVKLSFARIVLETSRWRNNISTIERFVDLNYNTHLILELAAEGTTSHLS